MDGHRSRSQFLSCLAWPIFRVFAPSISAKKTLLIIKPWLRPVWFLPALQRSPAPLDERPKLLMHATANTVLVWSDGDCLIRKEYSCPIIQRHSPGNPLAFAIFLVHFWKMERWDQRTKVAFLREQKWREMHPAAATPFFAHFPSCVRVTSGFRLSDKLEGWEQREERKREEERYSIILHMCY